MRKKPKGGKYRHLTVVKSRKGTPVIYYFKTENGKRIRISTEKDNWDEAAAWKRRRLLERTQEQAGFPQRPHPSLSARRRQPPPHLMPKRLCGASPARIDSDLLQLQRGLSRKSQALSRSWVEGSQSYLRFRAWTKLWLSVSSSRRTARSS